MSEKIFVSGHGSDQEAGLQPAPHFCGGSNTVTPKSSPLTDGTEAPLPARRPSGQHHVVTYFGPNQDFTAEMAKYGKHGMYGDL